MIQKDLKELYDMQAALDTTTILAITDIFGKITFVNDKFCEISQYNSKELIGKTHRIINSNFHEKNYVDNNFSGEIVER